MPKGGNPFGSQKHRDWTWFFAIFVRMLRLKDWVRLQHVNAVCRRACRHPDVIRSLCVDVGMYTIADDVTSGLSSMYGIRCLRLDLRLTDSQIKRLSPIFPTLETLALTGCECLESTFMGILRDQKCLRSLSMVSCTIEGRDRPNEKKKVSTTSIVELNVNCTVMSPKCFRVLMDVVPNLRALHIRRCPRLHKADLACTPTGLRFIDIALWKLSPDDIRELVLRWPNLEDIDVSFSPHLPSTLIIELRKKYRCRFDLVYYHTNV